jgi:hypothetical protein
VRSVTTVYTTRVDREVTSTVFVNAAVQPTSSAVSSDSPIVYSPVPEVSATVVSSAEESMVVRTTGVSQVIPDIPGPSATEDTPPAQPNPTAPPFTCPDDNGMTTSQMLGSERFDYDVFCDTTIASESIPIDLSYDTFSECVAACSIANAQFAQPVCQGAAYFETTGINCFLKSVANASDTVAAIGVDLAILKRVAVGITAENIDGTSTEPVVFSGETPTLGSSEVGSMIGGMLGNSTSTVPIVVPDVTPPPGPIISGRPALDGITAYSTLVSNGETVSTGTGYSSYFSNSSDGSWFYTYYSEWSLAWTDVQTIYGSGSAATAVPVAANNDSTVVEFFGSDGGHTEVHPSNTTTWTTKGNQTVATTTELIGTNEYDANGTLTSSTTVTNFYIYTTAAESGSGSGSGGGIAGSGAGVVTSTTVSSFSTQTVIYSSGGTGGSNGGQGSGGQVIQTPGPVIPSGSAFSIQSVNTITVGAAGSQASQGSGGQGEGAPVTSTFTSAFGTQTVIVSSGNAASDGGGEGGGALGSTVPVAGGSSVIFISGGTAFSTGGVASGVVSINGTSGTTSAVGSGAVVSNAPAMSTVTELSVILISGGTSGVFSTGGQGQGPSVITSIGSSGGSFSFSNTGALRTPKPGDSDYVSPTETPTGPAPYPPASMTPSGSIPPLNAFIPISTGASFANSHTLRTGGFSTSSGPALLSGPSGSIVLPVMNASLPIPTGTSPGSFTNSQTLRTGLQTTSPGGPVPYPPFSTAPAPSSELPSLDASLPIPTGTAPGTAPLPPLSTGPSSVIPPANASIPVGTGTAPSIVQTLSLPTGTGSSSLTFTNTNRPRSGTLSAGASSATSRPIVIQTLSAPSQSFTLRRLSSTGGASMALSTSASSNSTIPPFPTGTATPATSCPPMAVSTTTFWATTTEFGCYDFCPPNHGGFYGSGGGNPNAGGDHYRGPQSFGPPAAIFAPTLVGNPIPEPTEPTSPA